MDLRQGGHFQIERIISKHVYFQKWSHQRQYQYEVKYKGESYLNTRWISRQELDNYLVDQYERQFSNLSISEEKGGNDIQNGSQDQDNYSSKELEGRKKQSSYQKKLRNISLYQQSRPRMVKEFNNLQGLTNFKLCINTPIKKQQNHFIYGDRVQEILSQIHNVYQKVNKNQQKSVTDNNINSEKQLTKRDFYQERLVKKIEMNLGDYEKNRQLTKVNNLKCVRNKQQETRRGLYTEMSELKQMQALKERGVFIKIFMRVKWTDGTVSKVKMDYMNQYEPQMMVRYRDSRKTYWREWKVKQKQIIIKSNTQNEIPKYTQNEILEQVKYLQTPKTSRSESESNYETSSSSSMAEMAHSQRNSKQQVQALILQKDKNGRKQYQSQQLTGKSIKRQYSLAQRQQVYGNNLIKKYIKPIEQEQLQNGRQTFNQNRKIYKQMREITGDKKKAIGSQSSLFSIKNYQVIEELQIQGTRNSSSKLKQQQQQKQKQQQREIFIPKKQKTITQYFKKNKTQQIIEQPHCKLQDKPQFTAENRPQHAIQDKPPYVIQDKPPYVIQDKPHFLIQEETQYISRKSINQEALQMSKSKKLPKTYGIDMKFGDDMLRSGNIVDKNRKELIDSKHTLGRRQSFVQREEKGFVQREEKGFVQRDQIRRLLQKERTKTTLQKEKINISLKNDIKNRQQLPKHIQVIEIDDD